MEDIYIAEEDRNDLEQERFALAIERIREIPDEKICGESLQKYFCSMAAFVLSMEEAWNVVESGRLRQMGILNLYACIGCPETAEDVYLNWNSADFHAHLGFVKAGEFHRCGYKFGRWYNMIWMEKMIGEHQPEQAPVRFLSAI